MKMLIWQIYPIQKKSLPPAYLRDYAHLRFRTAQTGALMRVRDALMRDWHDWFEVRQVLPFMGFMEILRLS